MIVVDTSALMAVLCGEPDGLPCLPVLEGASALCISAGTLAEAKIVAAHRNLVAEMDRLITGLGMEIHPIDRDAAEEIAAAYRRWGKGIHPAGLNFGDCFAYALARRLAAPLLFVGDDFRRTDIDPAVPAGAT